MITFPFSQFSPYGTTKRRLRAPSFSKRMMMIKNHHNSSTSRSSSCSDDFLDKSSSTISTTGTLSCSNLSVMMPSELIATVDLLSSEEFMPIAETADETKVDVEQQQQQQQSQKEDKEDERHVHFGTLIIHEHVVDIASGSLPSCGAPIGIGWERQVRYELDVEDYEQLRPGPPRRGHQMLLTKQQRTDILLAWGNTLSEVNRQTTKCEELRKQRLNTAKKSSMPLKAAALLKRLVKKRR